MPDSSRSTPSSRRDPGDGQEQTEIAELLGISRQHLYDILREHNPVSPVRPAYAQAQRPLHDPHSWRWTVILANVLLIAA